MHDSPYPSRIVVPAVVLLIAAGLRLWGLGAPGQPYGDESYYVFDASAYLGGAIVDPIGDEPPAVRIADEATWVHPPLGKWIIALLGIGPIGQRSIGWRLPSAVFGIAGVALLYLLALHLWRSVWWAGFAALLLALDGLHIVQSRMAMLDIFLTTFVTAAVLFLVLDRERMELPRSSGRWRRIDRLFGSPFRLWAGIFLGCAVATKWSGAFALPLVAGLCAIWAFTGDRRDGRSDGRDHLDAGGLVRARSPAVYLLSYGAFFYQHGFAVHDFLTLQIAMLHYQQGHLAVQPENSAAVDLATAPASGPVPPRRARWFVERRRRAGESRAVVGVPAVGAGRARADRSPADVARRGRLRRLRRDVPPVVRDRKDAVHLVHAAGRPVHVPGRRVHAPTAAGHAREAVAIGVGAMHVPRGPGVHPGVDRVVDRRTHGSTDSAGCPAGRSERPEPREGAVRGPPLLRSGADVLA